MKQEPQSKFAALAGMGLLAAVFVAVGSFGGTESITWTVVEAVILLLGLALLLEEGIEIRRDNAGRFLGPAVLLIFFVVKFCIANRGGQMADRWAAREESLRLGCCLCAFYVTLAVARTAKARRRVATALVALGLCEALYGMIQYLTGWQRIFTYVKKYYLEDATGTYINHNHFAGLLEMVLPLGVALASYQIERAIHGRRNPARSLGELLGRSQMHNSLFLAFVSLLLFVAVVFSRSRMGLISCAVSLLVMAALAATHKGRRSLSAALVLVLLAAGVGSTFWIGVEPIVSRFASLPSQEFSERQGGGRLAIWRDTMHLLSQHLWLGVGPGGFETAYTQVQTVHLDSTVDHAHNDYLELATEFGLVGAGLLFGMILTVAARTLRAFFAHPASADRALALGVFAGIVALLLHSLTDFNLYLPANGLVFAVLLGLGASIAAELPPGAASQRAAG